MGCLILAEPHDGTALAVAALLRRRHGAAQVQLRTSTEIALAPRWQHSPAEGKSRTSITFHDGSVLKAPGPTVIFNRIAFIGLPPGVAFAGNDRSYANAEMSALVASWLASVRGRVVNAPSSAALTTCFHRPFAWHVLAARAGLPTPTLIATTSTRRFKPPDCAAQRPDLASRPVRSQHGPRLNVFGWCSEPLESVSSSALVVGDRLFGRVPKLLGDGCIRLARLAGADLLGIDFARRIPSRELVFSAATAFPLLKRPEEVRALADFLQSAT